MLRSRRIIRTSAPRAARPAKAAALLASTTAGAAPVLEQRIVLPGGPFTGLEVRADGSRAYVSVVVARAPAENAIVVIDPCLNPDGRQRYVSWYENTVGADPDPHAQSAEHGRESKTRNTKRSKGAKRRACA